MKTLIFILFIGSSVSFGQMLDYSPSMKIDKTLSLSHYDTDYIYIENISEQTVNLTFELIEETTVTGWHTSICTGAICYINIPSDGEIGSILPGEQGYISFNFSTNQILGEGSFRFVITDKNFPEIQDTVTFHYLVEDGSESINQPWARVNFINNVITVLLKNPQFNTSLSIYNISGQRLVYLPVDAITSFRIDEFDAGTYIVAIRDETGREIKKKIIKIGQ